MELAKHSFVCLITHFRVLMNYESNHQPLDQGISFLIIIFEYYLGI